MVEQDLYPIIGVYREPLLFIEWVMAFLFLELAFLLYMRIKNKETKLSHFVDKASILFLLSYALMEIFHIFGDYYMDTQFSRMIIYNIGDTLRMILGLIFMYEIERFQVLFRKYLFTIIFTISTVFSIIIYFTAIELTQYTTLMFFWIPIILFFLIYIIKLSKKASKTQELTHINIKIYFSILGVFILFFGFGTTLDPVVSVFGLGSRLVGDVIQITSIIFLAIFFTNLPTLSEQDWKDKIDTLFLMRATGICIYYKFFKNPSEKRDEQNISSAINTIKMILKEISQNDGEMVIEKEGKVLITNQGKYITGVIIADQNLNSLNYLLKRLIKKVEFLYSNIIRDWDGEMEIFRPIENITQEIFLKSKSS